MRRDSVLIIGADSLIGRSLLHQLSKDRKDVIGTTRKKDRVGENRIFLDLGKNLDRFQLSESLRTAIICAGITKLDQCERTPEETSLINVDATLFLLKKLGERNIRVIFLSSSQVFDGSKPFRDPNDELCPTTEYGRQKAIIERKIPSLCEHSTIVRITKVIFSRFPLFSSWYDSLSTKNQIQPFSDMVMSPVSVEFVVKLLDLIIKKRVFGIFQVSNTKDVTYHRIALWLAEKYGFDRSLVRPLTAQDADYAYPIPRATTLDIYRILHELGLKPPNVRKTIEAVFPNP